ncbi:MAG: von Willebrand factor type A domain-containing protein, partial [Planctomycetales bacterium]|nr:von Willebrand factor type A domain-containing protein [Planctomycetales bacterium]
AIVGDGAQFKQEVKRPSYKKMQQYGEDSVQGVVDATLGSSFYGTNLKYSFEAAGSESAEKELSNDGGLARGELNGDFSGSNSNMMFDDASNSPTSRPDDSKSPRETIRYRGVEGTSLLTKEKQLELNRHSPSQDKAERGQVRTAAKEAGKKGDMSESAVEGPAKQQTEMRKRDWSRTSAPPAGLNETNAATEAFSTFSLHVSDVSFKLAQAALANGQWPDPEKVRIEEFVNAFDYGDPIPAHGEKVACRIEQSIHPFLQQRNLLRVSLRTAATGRSNNTPLRLTFLLDNSGSMERADRRQTIRRAFSLLAQQLTPNDQSTLISFARQPRLLVDKVGGDQSQQLISLIDGLPSEGGTNIELALQLAFEKALEQRADGAQNRIVLLTDGAVNLGDADPERLSKLITTIRDAGVAFDAAGICAEGLNDEVLEALTRNGDGRYYLLDTPDSADASFVRQIAGALRPSAKNVKVQIEFNPNRVGRYKLLGFEKHLLKQEDFRNDQVDAAEMAAAEAGVAIYQVETKPDGEGDIGSVSVRFRNLSTGQMIENRWPILYEANAPRPDQATPAIRIATSAALLAAKLRGEPLGETVDLKTLSDLISGLPDRNRNSDRVGQLRQMIDQTRQISGN